MTFIAFGSFVLQEGFGLFLLSKLPLKILLKGNYYTNVNYFNTFAKMISAQQLAKTIADSVMAFTTEEDVPQIIDKLRERRFTLADAGVPSRVFNSWKENGVIELPHGIDSKWVKLNFVDYVWLALVKDLRIIGIPIKDINKIRRDIFNSIPISQDNILTEDFLREGILEYLSKLYNSKGKAIDAYDKILEETGYKGILDYFKSSFGKDSINQLEYGLLAKLLFNKNASLIILFDQLNESIQHTNTVDNKAHDRGNKIGNAFIWSEQYSITNSDVNWEMAFNNLFHIRIPLSSYVSRFVANKENELSSYNMGWITPEEAELLEHVRNDNANEIKITLKDGSIEMLQVTKNLKPDIETKLLRTFGANDYGEIKYVFAKGKPQYIQMTKKFKPIKK